MKYEKKKDPEHHGMLSVHMRGGGLNMRTQYAEYGHKTGRMGSDKGFCQPGC